MTNFERITSDPAIMNGQPCIRGMRLTVRRVLEALAPGGGYILAPAHNFQPDTPPQNIVAMYRAGREF